MRHTQHHQALNRQQMFMTQHKSQSPVLEILWGLLQVLLSLLSQQNLRPNFTWTFDPPQTLNIEYNVNYIVIIFCKKIVYDFVFREKRDNSFIRQIKIKMNK